LRPWLRARCFWVDAAEGDAGAAIYCGKSQIGLSLRHDQSVPFRQAKIVGRRSHGSRAGAKGREKFPSAKIQHNPLKRLNSDERIQGNPSLSNPQNQGFRGQTARAQENPNRVDRTERRARRREGASRLHPNAERSRAADRSSRVSPCRRTLPASIILYKL
jgi:hypothetical protein